MELSRRDLLKLGFFGSAALMLPAERIARTQLAIADRIPASRLPQPFTVPFRRAGPSPPRWRAPPTPTCTHSRRSRRRSRSCPASRHPSGATTGSRRARRSSCRRAARRSSASSVTCQRCTRTLRYNVWTSIHLHGSASLPQYDGYASDVTSGSTRTTSTPTSRPARTLWYHDHGVHYTAQNAYRARRALPHARPAGTGAAIRRVVRRCGHRQGRDVRRRRAS